jgi:hypothetical protein
MLFNGHLDIQSDEFTHMSMSEWIFSSEDWTNFKYTLEISHNTHLFIKLRRLGKASFSVEVTETKNVWSSLWSTSDQLRSVDFDKILFKTELSEKLTYSWRQFKDGLFSCSSEIDNSIVKTSFHFNNWSNFRFIYNLFNLFRFFLFFLFLLFRFLITFCFTSNLSISLCSNFSSCLGSGSLLDFWFDFGLLFNFRFFFFLEFIFFKLIELVMLYFSASISNL